MAARPKETALSVAAGIAAAAVIWTVGGTYDDPSTPPREAASCPQEGIRLTTGPVNAAMGLRAMDVTLQNCGTGTYRVEGYPGLDLLDEDRRSVTGVSVVHERDDSGSDPGSVAPPRPVTLHPGETATADLEWRNTVTEAGSPMNLPYLTIEAKPGALPVVVAPDGGLDLGTTGKLRVGPWRATRADGVPASGEGSR